MYVNVWCLGDIEFVSSLFEDDFAKNDTHGDFHDDVYIYVSRDFNKVDKVHYELGAFIDSTMRMIPTQTISYLSHSEDDLPVVVLLIYPLTLILACFQERVTILIEQLRQFGVPEKLLFSPEDLLEKKNIPKVARCLANCVELVI